MLMMQVACTELYGTAELVCWVAVTSGVKRNWRVTFRETGETRWVVKEVYDKNLVEKEKVRKTWYVGGLERPC